MYEKTREILVQLEMIVQQQQEYTKKAQEVNPEDRYFSGKKNAESWFLQKIHEQLEKFRNS